LHSPHETNAAFAAAIRRRASSTSFPAAFAGSLFGPTMMKSLYITSKRAQGLNLAAYVGQLVGNPSTSPALQKSGVKSTAEICGLRSLPRAGCRLMSDGPAAGLQLTENRGLRAVDHDR